MAKLIRARSWAATPLGPIERWPERLKVMVEQVLASPLVASLVCGAERLLIYNDAAASLYGTRHPRALGRPVPESFPDIYPNVAQLYARVFAGESVHVPAQPLDVRGEPGRASDVFDAYLTPVRDDAGTIVAAHMLGFEIGGRLRAEAALRASETRHRAFLTASADVVYRMGPDWREMRALDGRAFIRDTEDPSEGWMEIYIDLEDQARVRAAIDDAVGGKTIFELVHRVRRVDGSLGWTHSRAVPILADDGTILEWIGAASDVTDRQEAQAALRASEERFRQFGDASSDVLWIRDAATLQWEYLTPAFETIYGLSREAALTGDTWATWSDLILPEDRQSAFAHIGRVRGGENVTFEYRVRRPVDGGIRWLRNTDFPMRDEAGHVVRIGGIGQDVTELKAAEAAVAESETRLRTLMEGIPQLVWRSGSEGRWTWASPQWLTWTGQTQEQSHGLGWLNAVHPEDHAAAMRAWDEAMRHGRLDVEYRVRRASDGAWLWHHTRSMPVCDAQGCIVEWLGTSTDIDDLRRLQARQEVLVNELQHRARNLLGVVTAVADRTVKQGGSADAFAERLQALSRAQGLLSQSGSDTVEVGAMVRAELAAYVEDASHRVSVVGPPVQLTAQQVQNFALALHELTTNAVKHGALKEGAGRLSVTWEMVLDRRERRQLALDWVESGVTVEPGKVTRRGYGTELIQEALSYALQAKVDYVLGGDGVRCRIEMPVS